NLLRLLLSPHCLRPAIENWRELAVALVRRVLRESAGIESLRADIDSLLDECVPDRDVLLRVGRDAWGAPCEVWLPVRMRAGSHQLAFFSTITTLGTPNDITLHELRIEALHPADAGTRSVLEMAAHGVTNGRSI